MTLTVPLPQGVAEIELDTDADTERDRVTEFVKEPLLLALWQPVPDPEVLAQGDADGVAASEVACGEGVAHPVGEPEALCVAERHSEDVGEREIDGEGEEERDCVRLTVPLPHCEAEGEADGEPLCDSEPLEVADCEALLLAPPDGELRALALPLREGDTVTVGLIEALADAEAQPEADTVTLALLERLPLLEGVREPLEHALTLPLPEGVREPLEQPLPLLLREGLSVALVQGEGLAHGLELTVAEAVNVMGLVVGMADWVGEYEPEAVWERERVGDTDSLAVHES